MTLSLLCLRDTDVIPGQGGGLITRYTCRCEMRRYLGRKNLSMGNISFMCCTRVETKSFALTDLLTCDHCGKELLYSALIIAMVRVPYAHKHNVSWKTWQGPWTWGEVVRRSCQEKLSGEVVRNMLFKRHHHYSLHTILRSSLPVTTSVFSCVIRRFTSLLSSSFLQINIPLKSFFLWRG